MYCTSGLIVARSWSLLTLGSRKRYGSPQTDQSERLFAIIYPRLGPSIRASRAEHVASHIECYWRAVRGRNVGYRQEHEVFAKPSAPSRQCFEDKAYCGT